MKTLNDYIRESLLDDEEELIGRSIKDSQNPFLILANLSESECDNKSTVLKIIRSIKFPKPIDNEYLNLEIRNYSAKQSRRCCYYNILYPPNIENTKKLNLIFEIIVLDKDDKRLISIQSGYNKDVYEVFKNFTRYNTWIKDTAKKYDIKYSI